MNPSVPTSFLRLPPTVQPNLLLTISRLQASQPTGVPVATRWTCITKLDTKKYQPFVSKILEMIPVFAKTLSTPVSFITAVQDANKVVVLEAFDSTSKSIKRLALSQFQKNISTKDLPVYRSLPRLMFKPEVAATAPNEIENLIRKGEIDSFEQCAPPAMEQIKSILQKMSDDHRVCLLFYARAKKLPKLEKLLTELVPSFSIQKFQLSSFEESIEARLKQQDNFASLYVFLKLKLVTDLRSLVERLKAKPALVSKIVQSIVLQITDVSCLKNTIKQYHSLLGNYISKHLLYTLDTFFIPLYRTHKEGFGNILSFLRDDLLISIDPAKDHLLWDSDFSTQDACSTVKEMATVWPACLHMADKNQKLPINQLLLSSELKNEEKIELLDLYLKRPEGQEQLYTLGPAFLIAFLEQTDVEEKFTSYFKSSVTAYFEKMTSRSDFPRYFYKDIVHLSVSCLASNSKIKDIPSQYFPLTKNGALQTTLFCSFLEGSGAALDPVVETAIQKLVLPKLTTPYAVYEVYLYGISLIAGKLFEKCSSNKQKVKSGVLLDQIKKAKSDESLSNFARMKRNILTPVNDTPLHIALTEGKVTIAKELIHYYHEHHPFYLYFVNREGFSPIMLAMANGQQEIFSLLLAKELPIDFEKNESFLENFLKQQEIVLFFLQHATKKVLDQFVQALLTNKNAMFSLVEHGPPGFISQLHDRSLLPTDFSCLENFFVAATLHEKFTVANTIIEIAGKNCKLSEAALIEICSGLRTSRQLEFIFKTVDQQFLSRHDLFIKHEKLFNPHLISIWYQHLKKSQRIDFHSLLTLRIKGQIKSSPGFFTWCDTHAEFSALSVLLHQASYTVTKSDYNYVLSSLETLDENIVACLIENKVPFADWTEINRNIEASIKHINSFKNGESAESLGMRRKHVIDIFAGRVNPSISCDKTTTQTVATLISLGKTPELLAYVMNVLQTYKEPKRIEHTLAIAKGNTLLAPSLKSRFLSEENPAVRVAIIEYIALMRARDGISLLCHCLKTAGDAKLLQAVFHALSQLHINLPPENIERMLALCEIQSSNIELKIEAAAALWAVTHDSKHPIIKKYLINELKTVLQKNILSELDKKYVLILIETLAHFEFSSEESKIVPSILTYLETVERAKESSYFVDLIIALHRFSQEEVLQKVLEIVRSPVWKVFDQSYGENLSHHHGHWTLFLSPDRGIQFNRDSMERRIQLKRLKMKSDMLSPEIDAIYQNYLEIPKNFPQLVNIKNRLDSIIGSTRFVGVEEIVYDAEGVLYRGLKPRKGDALYKTSIIDTILGGCIGADLTNMMEQFDNASWCKTGQVFCSQSKNTASGYSGLNDETRGHIILIDPTYIQEKLDNAQARNEFEGGSLNQVIYDGIDKRGIIKILIDEKYKHDITLIYGLLPITELRPQFENYFFRELSDSELKLLRFHLRQLFPVLVNGKPSSVKKPYFARFEFIAMSAQGFHRALQSMGYKDLTLEAISASTIKRAIGLSLVAKNDTSQIHAFTQVLCDYTDLEFQQKAPDFVKLFNLSDVFEQTQSRRSRNTSILQKTERLITAPYGLRLKTMLNCQLISEEKVRKILRLSTLFLYSGRAADTKGELSPSATFAQENLQNIYRVYDVFSRTEQNLIVSLLNENQKLLAPFSRKTPKPPEIVIEELERAHRKAQLEAVVSFDEYLRMLCSLCFLHWTDKKGVNNNSALMSVVRNVWDTLPELTKAKALQFYKDAIPKIRL